MSEDRDYTRYVVAARRVKGNGESTWPQIGTIFMNREYYGQKRGTLYLRMFDETYYLFAEDDAPPDDGAIELMRKIVQAYDKRRKDRVRRQAEKTAKKRLKSKDNL